MPDNSGEGISGPQQPQGNIEKYCGVGLRYVMTLSSKENAHNGNVVAIIRSPYETPAQKIGIPTGSIVEAVDMLGDGHWTKVTDFRQHDLFLGTPGSSVGIKYFDPKTHSEHKAYAERDYIVPIWGNNIMPTMNASDLANLPEAQNAKCEWNISELRPGDTPRAALPTTQKAVS